MPRKRTTILLLLAATPSLVAASASAEPRDLLELPADTIRVRIETTKLAPVSAGLPVEVGFAEAREAWQREWRTLEARLLSLGTLPVEVALRAHAALRSDPAQERTPTRFAPDTQRAQRDAWFRTVSLANAPDTRPAARKAVLGGHARSSAPTWVGVHVWAEGAGYAVGRRSAGYGIECGAALPLDDHLDLTAGYRLAGYTVGQSLDPELTDVDARVGTPFVGLDFHF